MEQSSFIACLDTPPLSGEAHDRIRFDRYTVLPASRLVLRDGLPIVLGGRAFDLLLALLCARGEVISKADLIRRVWPRMIVEDNNVRVQMALLRKSLGTAGGLIKTVSGRGYIFVAEVWCGDRDLQILTTLDPPNARCPSKRITDHQRRPS